MSKMKASLLLPDVCRRRFGLTLINLKIVTCLYYVKAFRLVTMLIELTQCPHWSSISYFISSILVSLALQLVCASVSTTTTRKISTIWWFEIGSQLSQVISIFGSPAELYKSGASTLLFSIYIWVNASSKKVRGATQGQSMADGILNLCLLSPDPTHAFLTGS